MPLPVNKPAGAAPAAWIVGGLLAGVLVVHLPAFLCLPLDADVSEWDLCTRTVLGGGVLYRDALENNFPGMLWLELAARSLVGWSSEALRAVDLGVVAASVWLLVRWLPEGASGAARLATALVMTAFYLSTSEWCHCQRDTWMLLPVLLAVDLRRRQVFCLTQPQPSLPGVALRSVAEGLLWAAAFWIKPFVAVPALTCWLVSARNGAPRRWLALDGALWVAGGLLGGAAGCAWLAATGAWADFWDVMWSWNREYVTYDVTRGERLLLAAGFTVRMFPWLLIHLAAVPIAWRGLRRGDLLSALYLGWTAQAFALQHLFDYVHVPALLLAIAVVCRRLAETAPCPARTCLAALLLSGLALRMPGPTLERVALWTRCLREGSSAQLRDRLSLLPRASWADLERVRNYLAGRGTRDGELTCYNMRTLSLYLELRLRPSTRYFLLENILAICPRQRGRVCADLAAGRQRFFLCDLDTTTWRPGCGPAEPGFAAGRILYRAGRYAVFAVDALSMPAWVEEYLDP